MATDYIKNSFLEAQEVLRKFSEASNFEKISQAVSIMCATIKNGGKILSCGNGGSMSDAMHFAEELTGRYRRDRPPLAALAISDPSHLSCVANDFGYQYVFSRVVESLGKKEDTLLAISTSGKSPNILEAVKIAKNKGMKVVGLSGKDGGELIGLADITLIAPAQYPERIQEIHIKIIHTLIEGIERQIYPQFWS